MRLLLDTCVWGTTAELLREAGHDVIWTGDWEVDPGDDSILSFAYQDRRIFITIDKDFGELAVLQRKPHCGIVRIVNFSARRQAEVCLAVLAAHGEELQVGAIVTAEPGRLRIRLPEDFS